MTEDEELYPDTNTQATDIEAALMGIVLVNFALFFAYRGHLEESMWTLVLLVVYGSFIKLVRA